MKLLSMTTTFSLCAVASASLVACHGSVLPKGRFGGLNPTQVWTVPSREVCAHEYAAFPSDEGALQDEALIETSGVVASRSHPGVLWMHNDSGDSARLFALRTDGTSLGRLVIRDAEFKDAEDIAAAPCPDLGGACLYVADTGDAGGERGADLMIYAVLEPDVTPDKPLPEDAAAERVWRLPITVPGGPANIEAIAVAPDATGIYLYEKREDAPARIFMYPAPWTVDEPFTLIESGRFNSPGVGLVERGRLVTGASMHPSGTRILLRSYTGIFEYRFDTGRGGNPGDLASIEPLTVALGPLSEPQGEAVGYDEAGTGIWSVSESPDKEPGQVLHHFSCE